MEKKKLITVKHFLNKRLKPKIYRNEKLYPSYCQITYLRHNTQFLFDWDIYIYFEDEDEYKDSSLSNRFTEETFTSLLEEEVELIKEIELTIEKAILFEEKRHGEKFHLKGFSKRLEFYNHCFTCDLLEKINKDLKAIINKKITRKQSDRLWEKMEWRSLLDVIEYVEKKEYITDINKKIDGDLNDRINTYYLIESFMEQDENARSYDMWLFDNGFSKFSDYLNSKNYLKKENPFYKDVKKLKLKENIVYSEIVKESVFKNLKRMEESQYK